MKITVLYPYFNGEDEPGHSMMFRLVRHLSERGHAVTVITMNNNYMEGSLSSRKKKLGLNVEFWAEGAVNILSPSSEHRHQKSLISRLHFYLKYTFFVGLCLIKNGRPDLIFCSSPPIFHSLPASFYSIFTRTPILLEVRDLWPASLIEMGLVKSKINIWLLSQIERLVYFKASKIVCYTRGIYNDLYKRFNFRQKLEFIHCGVDLDSLSPAHQLTANEVDFLGLADKHIALYFGAIGYANNIEFIVKVANQLNLSEDIHFLLIGDGIAKEKIVSEVNRLGLKNITILPPVAKKDAAMYINIASVCLVTLMDRPVFSGAIPTKMIDYMACSKPVVSNVQGEARQILSESGAGITTMPADIIAFADSIKELCCDREKARLMGALGRKYVGENFSICQYLGRFENAINSALEKG